MARARDACDQQKSGRGHNDNPETIYPVLSFSRRDTSACKRTANNPDDEKIGSPAAGAAAHVRPPEGSSSLQWWLQWSPAAPPRRLAAPASSSQSTSTLPLTPICHPSSSISSVPYVSLPTILPGACSVLDREPLTSRRLGRVGRCRDAAEKGHFCVRHFGGVTVRTVVNALRWPAVVDARCGRCAVASCVGRVLLRGQPSSPFVRRRSADACVHHATAPSGSDVRSFRALSRCLGCAAQGELALPPADCPSRLTKLHESRRSLSYGLAAVGAHVMVAACTYDGCLYGARVCPVPRAGGGWMKAGCARVTVVGCTVFSRKMACSCVDCRHHKARSARALA
jgi:hypothetical protein